MDCSTQEFSVLGCLGEFARALVLPAISAGLTGLLELAVEAPFEKSPAGELSTGPQGKPESPCPLPWLQRVVIG